jgi:hypothetical protein
MVEVPLLPHAPRCVEDADECEQHRKDKER